MKNETVYTYDAEKITSENVKNENMITDARIRLVGHYEPTVTINNRHDLESLVSGLFEGAAFEEFHCIAVDCQCRVIAETTISEGDINEVSAYPRKIAAFAILSNAHSIFMAHNHPAGTYAPSCEDIQSTLRIEKALKLFNIRIVDHMIYAGPGKTYSMKQHGDF